jgi:chromosomal replication initiation ATPase DnaA
MYKSAKEIKEITEAYFNTDFSVKSSLRKYVYPKSILCFILRQNTTLSTRKIANLIGYKSNQVVLYHEATIEANKIINKQIIKDLEGLEKMLAL